ncbi:hypothetical protein [Streptomyces ziwulingensis]|uniref:Hemerythrin-like domain-containing protein n=1 Tax=Streptomyces ziwulingensis TaxID=1045501 RepID=A0ABP9AZT0_9ACTN
MNANVDPDSRIIPDMQLIHETHRMSARLLIHAIPRPAISPKALIQLREFVVVSLRHHHETEVGLLWLHIMTVAPGAANAFAQLNRDYERLDAALARLADIELACIATTTPSRRSSTSEARNTLRVLCEAATAVRDSLYTYLGHQEASLFPLFQGFVTRYQWEEFLNGLTESIPPISGHVMGFPRWISSARSPIDAKADGT